MSYDSWKLATPPNYDLPEIVVNCEICSETYEEDDHCQNQHCHCQRCGEELPEVDGNEPAHCENCCECDSCCDAWQKAMAVYHKTGEYNMPVVTGEKVYTYRDRDHQ